MEHDQLKGLRLAQHTLRVSDPSTSIAFYREGLGMALLSQRSEINETHFFLGFSESATGAGSVSEGGAECCVLTLVHKPMQPPPDVRKQPDKTEGYWKIALSVEDVDIARNRLRDRGIEVERPRQVPDIAYLCHLTDPDGYCIELIQHNFQHNHDHSVENPEYALGVHTSFLLITFRVRNISRSLAFYRDFLGMRLLSRQVVSSRRFTLYFFAFTNESPPHIDVEHIDNREWLWKRPYTMVELQHVWGTENRPEFSYRVGSATGFEGISIAADNFDHVLSKAAACGYSHNEPGISSILGARTADMYEPDGYAIRVIGT